MYLKQLRNLSLMILFASPAFAQTTTTDTTCQTYGQQTNCTSQTTANNGYDEFGKGAGTLVHSLLVNRRQKKQFEEAVSARVVYCQQNPKAILSVPGGQTLDCAEELARVKAACTVKPKYAFCKLLAGADPKRSK
jgi:hypothetical protein